MKKLIVLIAIVIIFVAGSFLVFNSGIEHIEDTNGADNYSLQEITDDNIINMDTGALNLVKSNELFNDLPVYKSDKYTGVSEIYLTNLITNRFDITLYNTYVNSGNLRIVLIYNDEIVHDFKINEVIQTYTLENVNGTVSLRVAGESADFEFCYDLI